MRLGITRWTLAWLGLSGAVVLIMKHIWSASLPLSLPSCGRVTRETQTQSECNQHSKTRWAPGSCCYQCGKQWLINYVCSRHCGHYDSGKLSVTFRDPVHVHGEYGCTEKAQVTSCSRKGHSCSWTKRCRISSISSLKCLWSHVITTVNTQHQCLHLYTLITSSPPASQA